jgi:threonyl-tRNA synthetase
LTVLYVFGSLGFENFTAQISLRDKENRESTLEVMKTGRSRERYYQRCSRQRTKHSYRIWRSCFLWSKVGFHGKDALGRQWQLGTIQVDYNLPERFDLTYKGSDNELHRPVMIHRAPFGSMERFIAILLEHTAGNFPLWLMPEQAIILSLSENMKYMRKSFRFVRKSRNSRPETTETKQ